MRTRTAENRICHNWLSIDSNLVRVWSCAVLIEQRHFHRHLLHFHVFLTGTEINLQSISLSFHYLIV